MTKNKKTKIPVKKSMNLYQPVHRENPFVVMLVGIFACVALLAGILVFAVMPKYQEITSQRLYNTDLSDKLTQYQAKMSDYYKVKEEYYRYADFLNADGAKLVDRVVIINIVEECIKEFGEIPSIAITDNTVSIGLVSSDSAKLADSVAKFESNKYVDQVKVASSAMVESEVTSVITIYVSEKEGE